MDVIEQGLAIRTARLAQRLTQAHLAQAAGCSEKTVRRAEQGERLQPESVRAISAILGLDATALRSEADLDPRAAEAHRREARKLRRLVSAMGATYLATCICAVLIQWSGIGIERAMRLTDGLWLLLAPLQVAMWVVPLLLVPRARRRFLAWFVTSRAVARAFAWAPLYASVACVAIVPLTVIPAALMIPWFIDGPDPVRGALLAAFLFSSSWTVTMWATWISGSEFSRLLADLPAELGRTLSAIRPAAPPASTAP
jgi:transcriptional regulator with XRE-family HTH domain